MLAGKLESNLRRTDSTVDSPSFATALMDRVDQLERGDHAPGRVAIVTAAGADAIEPVLNEQKAFLAAVARRFVFRRSEGLFERVPLRLGTVDFQDSGGTLASGIPMNPPLAAADRPATFTDPAWMPIAAQKGGDAAVGQIENRNAAVLNLGLHRAKDTRARRHSHHCLAGDIEQRIEPMAGQPT